MIKKTILINFLKQLDQWIEYDDYITTYRQVNLGIQLSDEKDREKFLLE